MVLSKGYTKGYFFRGDGSITYKNGKIMDTLLSDESGGVVNIENMKQLVLDNIQRFQLGTSIINFISVGSQRGTMILSKTSDNLFSFFYFTGYLAYTIYRQYNYSWNE